MFVLEVFGFPFFMIFASGLSSILLTRSLHIHLLILANLMPSSISWMLRILTLWVPPHRVCILNQCTMMHLIVFDLYESSYFSYRTYILSSLACLSLMSTSNFRTNVPVAVQLIWRYLVFHFLRFVPADYHPFCLHVRLFILTNLADVSLRVPSLYCYWCSLGFSFSLFLVDVWWWLFPLWFQWRRSLQVSHEFYISLSSSQVHVLVSPDYVAQVTSHRGYLRLLLFQVSQCGHVKTREYQVV